MRSLAARFAKAIGMLVVVLVLGFGVLQANAAAAAMDHCQVIPGPGTHCDFDWECEEDCPGAVIVECTTDPPVGCCLCIW